MTTTSTTYAPSYGTSRDGAFRTSAARLLAGLARAIASEVRVRRDTRHLMEMSDHMLSDIGLSRSQVTRAVRSGRA
jgi:uncharacterized protein YjiS (DUF1127 family)